MIFAMKTMAIRTFFRGSALLVLPAALALTDTGCNGVANTNPGGGNPPSASIANVNPTSGAVGSSVTIAGANFGSVQGTSTVTFNGTAATPTSWSATTIVAPVPAGATTGNVVVTVGGVASNGVSFTVTAAVAGPSIMSLNPISGGVGAPVTIAGANFGATQGTSTVTFNGTAATPTSWSATSIVVAVPPGATTGSIVVTVGGVASNGVNFTVSSGSGSSMGPLKQSTVNTRYFVDPAGNAVFLSGSHTWDDFQDTSTAQVPAAFPFTQYVAMLKANGQNATILWHKELPRECNWQNSHNYNLVQQPWLRNGGGTASDGFQKFDLTQFDTTFFSRIRSEAVTLQQNGIYAIVELFDGNNLTSTRCGTNSSPNGDGFPLTGANNINGVDDGYTGSGSCGVGAVTQASATTNPNLLAIQDAYVKKMIDTLNDLPNVIWEVSEEQPGLSFSSCSGGWGGASSMSFWAPHILNTIKTYEASKPLQHLAGVGSMNSADFATSEPAIYSSTFDWIAPMFSNNFSNQFPCTPYTNNQGKLVINDTDHSCGASTLVTPSTGAVNDTQIRESIWGTFTRGGSGYIFMDPYVVWLSSNNRNPCANPVNDICPQPMTKYDPFRAAMGYVNVLVPKLTNLLAMTPQSLLSSTGYCLANNSATGFEFVVYSKAVSSFTVNLSGQSGRLVKVAWLDPTTGTLTQTSSVNGGNATQTFSAPWGNTHDAVLHLTDGG